MLGTSWLTFHTSGHYTEPRGPQSSLAQNITPLAPASYQTLKHASKQSVVRFANEANQQDFLKANNLSSQDLRPVPELANTYVVNRPDDQLKPAGSLVAEQKHYTALLTPNDPIYPQWYTDKISAPAAWDISTGASSIIVADIDTGFALNHEDLAGRWAPGGKDFVNNDNDPSAGTTNPNGIGVTHGTETAGLIGATGNNAKGVASINWGAKILPLQALDDAGEGTTTAVASAVHYAVDQGAKVINMSLGAASPDLILKAELDYAQSHDVVVVAAAGNCGNASNYFLSDCSVAGQMIYPANYPQVLAVGATDINDNRASFSSYGPNLDIMAPGLGNLRTTTWSLSNQTSLYSTSLNGTSFSSPIVAGLAALYRGLRSNATVSETINAITANADKVSGMASQNRTDYYGYGRLNARAALGIAHPDGTLILTPTGTGVMVVQNGKASPLNAPSILISNGYSWNSIKSPTAGDNQLAPAAPLSFREGSLLEYQGHVYVVDVTQGGVVQKRGVASWDTFVGLGYSVNDLLHVSPDVLPAQDGPDLDSPNQHPDGTLVYTANHSGIILIENGQRRGIMRADIFNSYGYQWNLVRNPTTYDNSLPVGADLDSFREGSLLEYQGHVYVVDVTQGGVVQKRGVASWDTFVGLGYSVNEIMSVPLAELPSQDGPLIL